MNEPCRRIRIADIDAFDKKSELEYRRKLMSFIASMKENANSTNDSASVAQGKQEAGPLTDIDKNVG